jgi:hypothetical protein
VIDIYNDDILKWAESYNGEKFHAVLTDCPYEYGFMGKSWDDSGISFQKETWAAIAEHMYPGAFGMTYGGARTYHRIAVAIEDANLIIHPSIFAWVYASGFPKATRIDTQIDKREGVYEDREVIGKHDNPASEIFQGGKLDRDLDLTEPATELGKIWEGHRYGLQSLKPAVEPIIMFQKPYDDKAVSDITATGAGALWIDGARIQTIDGKPAYHYKSGPGGWGFHGGVSPERSPDGTRIDKPVSGSDLGRWPANFAVSHHPECKRIGVKEIDGSIRKAAPGKPGMTSIYGKYKGYDEPQDVGYADENGKETVELWECHPDCAVSKLDESADQVASRYFYRPDWSYEIIERLNSSDQILYSPKASRKERDIGLEDYETQTVQQGCAGDMPIDDRGKDRDRFKVVCRNPHPTVKPMSLNIWLATLLLPPPEYAPRRILIPFSGVMSEGLGAWFAGWDHVSGVEQSEEYCDLAMSRVEWWIKQQEIYGDDISKILSSNKIKPAEKKQEAGIIQRFIEFA